VRNALVISGIRQCRRNKHEAQPLKKHWQRGVSFV
jgi:hypothetical protein